MFTWSAVHKSIDLCLQYKNTIYQNTKLHTCTYIKKLTRWLAQQSTAERVKQNQGLR